MKGFAEFIASEYFKAGEKTALIICGPTASGKSALSEELCGLIGGEIVSCDSMQIYRMMDIGTAKPTASEREACRYHMIDIADPWENYSAYMYKQTAATVIDDIFGRSKVPVICGGTGLYVNALIDNREYSEEPEDFVFDEKLREDKELSIKLFNENDRPGLHLMLEKYDPEAAGVIHQNNVKRVFRALTLYFSTGKTRDVRNKESLANEADINYLTFGLFPERNELYEKINARVDIMREKGLSKEVEKVYSACRDHLPAAEVESLDILKYTALSAIGYKELIPYLDFPELKPLNAEGFSVDSDILFDRIKQDTRQYAKRQITWFKRTPGLIPLCPS